MAIVDAVNTEVRTSSSVKTKSNYKAIAFVKTTNPVLTDTLQEFFKKYFNKDTGRIPPDNIIREGDDTLCVIIHDTASKLDSLIKECVFGQFTKECMKYLPSGTMGNIEYTRLVGYVKEPFRRTLPQKKNSLLHVYKK